MGYIVRPFALVALFVAIISTALAINEQDFAGENTIIRDVCILGGGATGTYAAIRLKDNDKSVAVVEHHEVLGGHTETLYLDDGNYIDYGVEGVFNYDLARDFFDRLGVAYKPLLPGTLIDHYVNFRTGKKVPPPAGLLDTTVSALLYRLAIEEYDYLEDGLYNLPDPVPEELLQPFGEFVEKKSIQGALPLIFLFAHGVNLLQTPLLYVLQRFGIPHIDVFLKGGYITPTNGMYELYDKASQVLGPDVLYKSTVHKTERSDSGVIKVVVQSANGTRKLIKAKQLLITIPPTMENLQGFDLTPAESTLFKKWDWTAYYVAVVKNTGIPNDVNVKNFDPRNTPGDFPSAPFQLMLQYLGVDGHLASKIVADKGFTEKQAKELVLSDIRRMGAVGTYPGGDPEIVVFGSHSPEMLTVSNADVRDGFYKKLYALQGIKNTFYTGLAFCSDYSGLLWAYTETVVQKMVDS